MENECPKVAALERVVNIDMISFCIPVHHALFIKTIKINTRIHA
jgi:hypothetical protein